MAVSGRNIFRIIVALVVAALLGWQYFGPHKNKHRLPQPAASSSAPAPASSAALAVTPAPPRTWMLGQLKLTACELGRRNSGASTAAWCGKLKVPENRAQADSRKIELNLAVVRSDAAVPRPDMVVMLAGGPGQAATRDFADTRWYQGLLKDHNVLLLDQRGTGDSHPLDCPKVEAALKKDAPAADELDPERIRKNVADCLAEVQQRADPRFYTTTDAVADLEAVRQALGAPPLDLIGVSYGTRMAQQYLRAHPDSVRSVVLDSPVPNQTILGEDFAANLDAALKLDFADCIHAPECHKRFGDPMQTLAQLRDALRANPHEVSFRDPRSYHTVTRTLSEQSLAGLVRLYAYAPETAALLPLSIDSAAHGDVGPLLGQTELLTGDLSGDMNSGMAMSVVCTEDAGQLKSRPQDKDTILGNTLIEAIQAQCAVWPHGSMPVDFHAPLKSDKPILILSGARDPVTPPRYGDEIMAGLGNARHLVLKGQGHAVSIRGCTPRLIGEFINKAQPKKLDASCLDRLGPTPPYVNFNGATP